ncbi:MAG: zinc-binding dehydrogenase [Rhodospirillales bacterium]|nr:zinc-binding dehydrogenase [Rhodospirillales bacterium]
MKACLLVGNGGLEMLEIHNDVAVPTVVPGDVLIKVHACGMNNTDINTRTGWYSKTVGDGTTTEGATSGFDSDVDADSTWGGAPMTFPRIQGADPAGTIVAVGDGVDTGRIGERVMVDPWLRDAEDPTDLSKAGYYGSERNGGYAEYTTAPAHHAVKGECGLSNQELAAFSCSYSTAENMLARARLSDGEIIVISGASGGVGSALVQLAKRRGAYVIAIAGGSKLDQVRDVGPDAVIDRGVSDLASAIKDAAPGGRVDVTADVVGGDTYTAMIASLRRGGRYVTAGAIAAPIVDLDLRTLYLHDLELIGATVFQAPVYRNLVSYIERGEIRPLLAKVFPLDDIREAQEQFIRKSHVGNFVIDIDGT